MDAKHITIFLYINQFNAGFEACQSTIFSPVSFRVRGKCALKLCYPAFMKKRMLYALLFGIPGILWSLLVTAILVGVLSGVLWLFVYGDSAWS